MKADDNSVILHNVTFFKGNKCNVKKATLEINLQKSPFMPKYWMSH